MSVLINKRKNTKDYLTFCMLGGARVIPSDVFELEDNEYMLLEIHSSSENLKYLELMCIQGPDLGARYLVPEQEFENKTLSQIRQMLKDYQSNI